MSVEYKIVYTLSDNKKMLEELKYSILSAIKYVSKENIIVVFTPPSNLDDIHEIQKIATVYIKNKNIAKPFSIHPLDSNPIYNHYGDKIYIKDIDCPNILFLDCDTIIYNNPDRLFEGDFDFGGIATDLIPEQWQCKSGVINSLRRIYRLYKQEIHLWDGGSLIFKNDSHKKIGDEWLRIYSEERDKLDYAMKPNRKTYDQASLTPAIYKYKLKTKVFDDSYIKKVRNNWSIEDIKNEVIILHGNYIWDVLGIKEELDILWETLK